MPFSSFVATSVFAFTLASQSLAQSCDFAWQPGLPAPGLQGIASTAIAWDPDANGPAPTEFIVGGDLTDAVDVPVQNVARYNPTTKIWQSMGALGKVERLLINNNNLLFAVQTAWPDPTNGAIKRWDGSAWQTFAPYRAKAVFGLNGRLFGLSGNTVQEWNGSAWITIGTPVGSIRSLAVDNFGRLLVAGSLTSVNGVAINGFALFDGTTWSALPNGRFSSTTHISCSPNGTLYATGSVQIASSNTQPRFARLDGNTWTVLGPWPVPEDPQLRYSPTGEIFGVGYYQLNRWTGSAWVVDPGEDIAFAPNGDSMVIRATNLVGPNPYVEVAFRRGGAYLSPTNYDISPRVLQFAKLPNGNLLAAGDFLKIGNAAARNLAEWDGTSWREFAGGTDGPVTRVFFSPSGNLTIQGTFTRAGGVLVNGVGIWDGSAWSTIVQSATGLFRVEYDSTGAIHAAATINPNGSDGGLYRYENGVWTQVGVYADWLTRLSDGSLVGARPGLNNTTPSRWTGSQWVTLGASISSPPIAGFAQLADGRIVTLGQPPRILISQTWQPFAPGVATVLLSVLPDGPNGNVMVGSFYIDGRRFSVARYNGSTWTPLVEYADITQAGFGRSGELFVAGNFTEIDGQPSWRFASFLRDPACRCDSIDFNNNAVFPEDQDVIDFFNVLAGGPCSSGNTCSDIDFNNNTVFPEDRDVIDFFTVLAGGNCP
ncbi:hypothetical protein LBMAG48_06690 [Phycisphaerae bacterium]|nr:hypothetical protein LBMAG48_06690 [Phycisphaerae bacterium]